MRGIDLHQADPQVDVITPVVEVTRPTAMDYHAERGFLYLADSHRHKILRQKLDLGEMEDFVTSGLNNVMGMAVDWIGKNLYWEVFQQSRLSSQFAFQCCNFRKELYTHKHLKFHLNLHFNLHL